MSSPPRRRSARLASAATPKPKQVSTLSSLVERDETPDKGAPESLDAIVSSPRQPPVTPASSAIKPPRSEMHPTKAHPTVGPAGPEAWLGFRDIKSADVSRGKTAANLQLTPSRAVGVPSTPFTFNVSRPGPDKTLSANAQRMMNDLREEAAKIKADLVAKRELEKEEEQLAGRKIAKAKGKSGRFSAAHMAEFKKMDSILGHASSFRAQPGRLTPANKGSLKRSQSKASLEDSDTGNRDSKFAASTSKPRPKSAIVESPSPVKRVRKQLEDDASSSRPISRDGSSIPRPKSSGKDAVGGLPRSQSSLASLMSPTKASAARTGLTYTGSIKSKTGKSLETSTTAEADTTASPSPSKPSFGSLTKSATTHDLGSLQKTPSLKRRIVSPGRFEKVKSILRGGKANTQKPASAIPQRLPAVSKTPGPRVVEKPLPSLPMITPRRQLFKRVEFTPDTKGTPVKHSGEVRYPNLDAILEKMAGKKSTANVSSEDVVQNYDSSSTTPSKATGAEKATARPGTFTFRSDHTISFGATSPNGFGSSPGQSSIRHVRTSMMPTDSMPGSFPQPSEAPVRTNQKGISALKRPVLLNGVPHGLANEKRARANTEGPSDPNKENQAPVKPLVGIPHGMPNKKRARSHDDEEDVDQQGADRGGKRRKAEHGASEMQPAVTPKSTHHAGSAGLKKKADIAGHAPNSSKKRKGISMARLNMLAQPKMRR